MKGPTCGASSQTTGTVQSSTAHDGTVRCLEAKCNVQLKLVSVTSSGWLRSPPLIREGTFNPATVVSVEEAPWRDHKKTKGPKRNTTHTKRHKHPKRHSKGTCGAATKGGIRQGRQIKKSKPSFKHGILPCAVFFSRHEIQSTSR